MRKWHAAPFRTMRMRLTAWYVLFFGVTLLLFCLYLYVQLSQRFLDQTDAGIAVATSQVLAMVDDESHPPKFRAVHAYQEVIHRLSAEGFTGRLLSLDGTILDGFGN